MLPPSHEKTLETLLEGFQHIDVVWVLTGSTSFALQGVPVEPRDVDLQTDREGAYAIEAALKARFPGCVIDPVELREAPLVRSHLGRMDIAGLRVEIMGDIQKRQPGGPWEQPPDLASLRVFVPWKSWFVPVLPLAYEREAYLRIGRHERAGLLDRFIKRLPARQAAADAGEPGGRQVRPSTPPAQPGKCTVQCSTGSLAPLAGGRYWNVGAMIEGIRKLGWPAVELRLWQEWDEGDLPQVAGRVKETGVEVNSVHIPPDSELLLSAAGRQRDAKDLMGKCLSASLASGATVAVVHAWDLRRPEFCQSILIENLNRFAQDFASRGVFLSVESIPGHTRVIPAIAESCPDVTFTADTRWAAAERSWDLLSGLIPRLTNIHVQTYVDPLPGGGVALGRTGERAGAIERAEARTGSGAGAGDGADAGKSFDTERAMRRFAAAGYVGLVTLEPNGVPGVSQTHLRQALEMLKSWTVDARAAGNPGEGVQQEHEVTP